MAHCSGRKSNFSFLSAAINRIHTCILRASGMRERLWN
jgi:hypothetical protein